MKTGDRSGGAVWSLACCDSVMLSAGEMSTTATSPVTEASRGRVPAGVPVAQWRNYRLVRVGQARFPVPFGASTMPWCEATESDLIPEGVQNEKPVSKKPPSMESCSPLIWSLGGNLQAFALMNTSLATECS